LLFVTPTRMSCVCVRERYIDTRMYPVPHYAIREKPTFYANHVETRIKKKEIMF